MSFFIGLLLTIFVLMYASKNFPGVVSGTLKVFFMMFLLIIILLIVGSLY